MDNRNRTFLPSLDSPLFQLHWTASGELRQPHKTPPWTKLEYWIILSPQNGQYQGAMRDGRILSARGREILLIPPGQEYSLALTHSGQILGTGISFSLLGVLDIGSLFRFPHYLNEEQGQNLLKSLKELCQAHRKNETPSCLLGWLKWQTELQRAGYSLYSTLLELAEPDNDKSQNPAGFIRLLPLLDYMNHHNKEKMTRSQMGDFLGVCPQRVHCLFKHTLGFSPGEYERRNRLEGAKMALADLSKSITQVAEEFQYCDPFHFSKQFKARYGLSPNHYRQGKEKERVLGKLKKIPPLQG